MVSDYRFWILLWTSSLTGTESRMEEGNEVTSFKGLGICEQLVEACDNLGWKNPSKIQAEAIPHALQGLLLGAH